MDANKTGAFIAMLRKEKEWTQAELAQRLHVTDKAVSKWERGLGLPDINTIEPLADVLGVTVLELMRGEKQIEEEPLLPDEAVSETFAYVRAGEAMRKKELHWLWISALSGIAAFALFLFGAWFSEYCLPGEYRNFGTILSILPLIGAMVLFVALATRLLERSRIFRLLVGTVLLYLFYEAAVCAVFFVAGIYIFTTPPSPIVLIRLIAYPAVFTALTVGVLFMLRKRER